MFSSKPLHYAYVYLPEINFRDVDFCLDLFSFSLMLKIC